MNIFLHHTIHSRFWLKLVSKVFVDCWKSETFIVWAITDVEWRKIERSFEWKVSACQHGLAIEDILNWLIGVHSFVHSEISEEHFLCNIKQFWQICAELQAWTEIFCCSAACHTKDIYSHLLLLSPEKSHKFFEFISTI